MKSWLWLVYGLLLGLLIGGAILLIANPVPENMIALIPAPTATPSPAPGPTKTPTPIRVQISGEVQAPGIYPLQEGSRLQDLLSLAGGLTDAADIDRINGAALLRDGDYFYIPAVDEKIPETAANSPANLGVELDSQFSYPLDLNSASQEALESLPGIGPTKAEDIITYREVHGPFGNIDDLINVPGIGEVTIETLRDYLYVEP